MTETKPKAPSKPRKPVCPKRRRMLGLFKAWLDSPCSRVRSGHLRQALDEHELQARLRYVLPVASPVTPTHNGA